MTEILTRVMGVLQRVSDMSELSGAATVVFGVIFVFGLLNCILGYRILLEWERVWGLWQPFCQELREKAPILRLC